MIQFHLTLEIAAVDKDGAIAIAIILSGSAVAENNGWIVMMAGHAAFALDSLDAMTYGTTLSLSLHIVPSIEMNQIHRAFRKIQL